MIRGVVPEVLVGFGEALDVKPGANHRVASAEQPTQEPFRIGRIPCQTDGRLRAHVPGSVLMAAGVIRWIGDTCERPRLEDVSNPRGSIHPRLGRTVISAGQVVIVAREIPAQPVVDREMGGEAERVLGIEPPAFLQFIQIVGRSGCCSVLSCLYTVRKTAPDWAYPSDSSDERGVQPFRFGPVRGGGVGKIRFKCIESGVPGHKAQGNVRDSVRRVPIMILFPVEINAKRSRMSPMEPSRVVLEIYKRIIVRYRKVERLT